MLLSLITDKTVLKQRGKLICQDHTPSKRFKPRVGLNLIPWLEIIHVKRLAHNRHLISGNIKVTFQNILPSGLSRPRYFFPCQRAFKTLLSTRPHCLTPSHELQRPCKWKEIRSTQLATFSSMSGEESPFSWCEDHSGLYMYLRVMWSGSQHLGKNGSERNGVLILWASAFPFQVIWAIAMRDAL